jgi:hypothetical protein
MMRRRQGWRQPNTTAAANKAAHEGKENNNIPGKSIPQWYSYRLYVKLMQTITGNTVSLCIARHAIARAAASTGTYLKRKQRAKILIRSIPSLSQRSLAKKDDTLWHQSSHGSYTGRESAGKL